MSVYMIVLGSKTCDYRVKAALEAAKGDPDTVFIVTGGNPHEGGDDTEAGFMSKYLKSKGVDESRIIIEDRAVNTFQNLELSAGIIETATGSESGSTASPSVLRIGIVTGAFHIPRTRLMKDRIPWYDGRDVTFIPAYGNHTRPDNWYSNPIGRELCLSEIAKREII